MKNVKLVKLPDFDYEWLYVDDKLVATGEPIDADQWLKVLDDLGMETGTYELTDLFGERNDWSYNNKRIPKHFSKYLDGDLEE